MPNPAQTYNDAILDEQGRRIWVKAMAKIEAMLDASTAPNPDLLGALASAAVAANEQVMEQSSEEI